MYTKIYFGNKPLFLCDKVDKTIEPFAHHDDAIFIDEFNQHTIKTIIHEMEQSNIHAGIFLHHDLAELKTALFKKFTLVQAAGGLVTNENDEVLMIFRRGMWDLPKGKLDPGETLEQCAIREVEEETGLTHVELVSPLVITYHTYHEGSKFILKESHWYKMKVGGQQNPTPQVEEDILELKWVTRNSLADYFDKSFPSVVDVLQTCLPV